MGVGLPYIAARDDGGVDTFARHQYYLTHIKTYEAAGCTPVDQKWSCYLSRYIVHDCQQVAKYCN